MKTDFLEFYEETIYPEIEGIEESLEDAKKFSKKIKKLYLKVFGISLITYSISTIIKTNVFAVLMFISLIMMALTLGFGVFQTTLNKIIISSTLKSYDKDYYSEILPTILYRFNNTFKRSKKVTFPEQLYRTLHIEKAYKKYSSSKCIIGNIEGCKSHVARIRTKGGFQKTQSIVLKVALKTNLKEKTFLISSRHHKKTNRNLPQKNFTLETDFNNKICIYTKQKNIRNSCLSNSSFRDNVVELHDILEGNVSVYVINNNIYFKINADKNIFNKNFFRNVNSEYFSKYDDALEKIQEIVSSLNY